MTPQKDVLKANCLKIWWGDKVRTHGSISSKYLQTVHDPDEYCIHDVTASHLDTTLGERGIYLQTDSEPHSMNDTARWSQ